MSVEGVVVCATVDVVVVGTGIDEVVAAVSI
jgi:hypothetical protein